MARYLASAATAPATLIDTCAPVRGANLSGSAPHPSPSAPRVARLFASTWKYSLPCASVRRDGVTTPSVVSRKFVALQRVPRGLWQGASGRVCGPFSRGATRPRVPIFLRGILARAPWRAPFGRSPCTSEPSAGVREGNPPRKQSALLPLRICPISLRTTPCIDVHGEL